jgi:predicted nucleic-acid-binding Zn-ribbon protein
MKCIKCANEENGNKRKLTTQFFIRHAQKEHGNKYDYSKTVYTASDKKLKIRCYKHGIFEQIPHAHLKGQGCPKCGLWNLSNTDTFKKRAVKIHGTKYDYSQINYVNARTKVKIGCSKHGIFEQTPQNHLKGQGCPICLESQGERKIGLYLDKQKITYKREKSFTGCRNKYKLFFDFYVPSLNACIEYDGSQHYHPIEYFGGEKVFKETQKSDAIKNKYCSDNGIKLIRIPYKNREEIETALKKELSL